MLRNDISLRESILLHVKDVSLKAIKRWVNDHFIEWRVIPDILREFFAKNVISISSINNDKQIFTTEESTSEYIHLL